MNFIDFIHFNTKNIQLSENCKPVSLEDINSYTGSIIIHAKIDYNFKIDVIIGENKYI